MVNEKTGPPEWHQTGSLVALREAIEAGARMRHLVARRAGLSDTELIALEHLSQRDFGPAELARILEVSTAASTGIADRLAQRGHVERRAHEADRRRIDLRMTESGREEVRAHLLPMFLALAELDASFSAEEQEVVERYLRGAIAAFERVSAQPPPSEA